MPRGSYIGMAAFSYKVNYANNLKSTSKTGLIAEIAQVITHEVLENEIVNLNVLLLNLSNVFQVSFYNIWLRMYPEITMLSELFIVSPRTMERISHRSNTYFRNFSEVKNLKSTKPNR